jgi:MFS family permease
VSVATSGALQAPSAALAGSQPSELSKARSTYVIVMFMLVSMFCIADRYCLSIMLEPIRKELGASDTTMGLLSGASYSLVFVIAGIPLARVADTGNRRNLLAAALAVWSIFTALSGAVANVVQLFIVRAGLAAAESPVQPAIMSTIGDMFSSGRRGLATAFVMIGGALGILVGSVVAGAVTELYGWRWAFVALGLPGILFAVVFWLTVPEPARQGAAETVAADPETVTIWRTIRYVLAVPTSWRLILASTILLATQGAWGAWVPTFFIRVHGMSMSAMSASFGVFMGLGAVASMIISGYASDWLARRGERWRIILIGAVLIIGVPFVAAALFVDNVWVAWGLIVCFQILTGGAPPMIAAAGLGIVRPHTRGVWVSMYNFSGYAIGGLCGPFLVGLLSDNMLKEYGSESLRYSLMIIPILLVPASLIYFWASLSANRDAESAAG